MTTSYTGRTPIATTSYTGRDKPILYITLLEGVLDTVQDLDGNAIWVYTDNGKEVPSTIWSGRTTI